MEIDRIVAGLIGFVAGMIFIIWINGRWLREISELVSEQNRLLINMAKRDRARILEGNGDG